MRTLYRRVSGTCALKDAFPFTFTKATGPGLDTSSSADV
jgi:hypothetical protein